MLVQGTAYVTWQGFFQKKRPVGRQNGTLFKFDADKGMPAIAHHLGGSGGMLPPENCTLCGQYF